MAVTATTTDTGVISTADNVPKKKRMERAFWVVSLIIALTDIIFIYVNHVGTYDTLYENLKTQGMRHEASFRLTLRDQGLAMQQFATYIANQEEVRQLFLAGREAVNEEGGGPGGPRAAQIREQLFDLISKGWLKVTGAYRARQLHFHMGPGDTSFLRVHKPSKFGDDLSSIRHTITHAIQYNQRTSGFESGRVVAGIRGVVPIGVVDPLTGTERVLGALEAGSSFSQMLKSLEADIGASYSVLMNKDYFFDTHWPKFAAEQVAKRPLINDYFIEATSNEALVRRLMANPEVEQVLGTRQPVISEIDGVPFAVYSFPFRDFLRTVNQDLPPIGHILAWQDASSVLAAADASLKTNMMLGVFGFLVIESLLFTAWTLARNRLQRVIDNQVQELSETNTSLRQEISLRTHYEQALKEHRTQLEHTVEQRTKSLTDTVDALEREMAQRQQAETTLQHERDQAQITLRSIVDGVITADADCLATYLNPAAEELTGWRLEDAVGKHLNDIFRARDLEHGGKELDYAACLDGKCERQHVESTELTRKDGNVMIVEHSLSPIRDQAGHRTGLVLVFHDDTEARELARRLSHQASHDGLTGLINRRTIELQLAEALQSAHSHNVNHAFMYIDLDQFKIVNDTCGHVAGDELLRQLAKLLAHRTRHSDYLARLGGDEFGLLLRDCEPDVSERIAGELLDTLRGFHFVWEGRAFRVGASIGVALIDATSESVESILSAADAACYLAKEKGRNRIHLSLPDDGELATKRGEMQWVARIQSALSEDRFVLYGQPIVPVDGNSDEPPHQELLVRMLDEDGELIKPTAFIPAAERYGLMKEVDRWIIEHAFRLINRINSSSGRHASYGINLSGDTMTDENVLDFIRTQLSTHRIEPQQICFEVTETAAITNMAGAIDLMTALKQDGCRFALDDFGSGLSSFGYLKALPVDYLKIDGNFVRNLHKEPVDHAMVQAINAVGHAMNLKTIAEFVENPEAMRALQEIGVDYAQGYDIGMPTPITSQLN